MPRHLLAWLLCLPLLIGQALAQVRPYDDIVASGVLKVAVYENFPPYSYQENGQARGVDVALANALARRLGLSLELVWVVPGETLEDDLRNYIWKGHYLRRDVFADVMLRVPYDREFSFKRNDVGEPAHGMVSMFGPYQRERWQVAYDSRRLEEVPSVAVFGYHPIGVEVDSVPSFYLSSVFGGRMARNTHHYPSPALAFAAMQKGEVDAMMAMRGEVDGLLRKAADPALKAAENAYPDMGRQVWDIGMAVHESNRQLANAIEVELEEMIELHEVEKLFLNEGLRYELPGLYQDVQ